MKIVFCDSAEIWGFSFIWYTGVLKRIGIALVWFQQVIRQSFLYILWKFGEIQISDPGVLGKGSCMAGVTLSLPMFAMGWGC